MKLTKGKQVVAINAGESLNTEEWLKPYLDATKYIIEREPGGASVFEAVEVKETAKAA